MENMVNVYFFGKKYSVPGDLTIMTAMEYAGYTLTRGCGCLRRVRHHLPHQGQKRAEDLPRLPDPGAGGDVYRLDSLLSHRQAHL